MKFYCYRHVRSDKGQPFYVGIGTKIEGYNTWYKEFERAHEKHGRNEIWRRIASKSDFIIEILFESDSEGEIKRKEEEFILLYGRIDLKTGSLSNMTTGGEGTFNITEEAKNKRNKSISRSHLKRSRSSYSKKRARIERAVISRKNNIQDKFGSFE